MWVVAALKFGDGMVVEMIDARSVPAEAEPVLHNVVEEMAIAAGLPKPRVVVIETPALNAFATGMKPEKATVGVTRGLLERLSRDELQGVVGHEMAHVANADTRYLTAVAVLVGLIALVGDFALRTLRFGAYGRGRVRYVPFPEDLEGHYQSFTQAELGALRAVGCDLDFVDVDAGVARYLDWLTRRESAPGNA